MKLWDKIKNVFAARPIKTPYPQTIPNMLFNYFQPIKNNKWQTTLPKHPNIEQLRNFAKNPVVRRPIALIEDYVSRLPYRIVPVDPNDNTDYTEQIKIIKNVIDNPNTIHTKRKLDRMILEDLLTFDVGVVEKAIGGDKQRPLFLYPTDGTTMQFIVPYDYTDPNAFRYSQIQPNGQTPHYFTAKQIAYIQHNVFTDRPQGLSPVLSAYNYICYYINALERSDDVASNSTADFLIHLKGTDKDKAKEFRDYMENTIQGTGTIPVSNGDATSGVETHQIRAINKDGLFLDWQNMLIICVGMAFGCPREKMMNPPSGDRLTGPDINNAMLEEMRKPYANLMEDFYNEEVINTMGYSDKLKYEYIYEQTLADKQLNATLVTGLYANDIITKRVAQDMLSISSDDKDETLDDYISQYKNNINMELAEKQSELGSSKGIGGYNGVGTVKDTTDEGGD